MRAQFLTLYTVSNMAMDTCMVEANCYNIDGFQISMSNSGKHVHVIKRQLYSGSFTSREAAFYFQL